VIYAAFTYPFYAADLTLLALLQDTTFSTTSYNLTSSSTGLTHLPLFGTGLIGTLLSGYTVNFVISFLTRHNTSVYKPEFRLVLMLVTASLSFITYISFGYSLAEEALIYIPIASLGVQKFSVPFSNISAMFTHVMDCHATHAAQALVTMEFREGGIEFGDEWGY